MDCKKYTVISNLPETGLEPKDTEVKELNQVHLKILMKRKPEVVYSNWSNLDVREKC